MRDRHALAAAFACVIALILTMSLAGAGAAGAQDQPTINLKVTLAAAGDTVGIQGNSGIADDGDCDVLLDGKRIDAACAVDKYGAVEGKFQIPATQGTGTVKVAVCQPRCYAGGDVPPLWSWSGALEIGVPVPDVHDHVFTEAEDTLEEVGLAAEPEPQPTDDEQRVRDQDPQPGTVVLVGSSVTLWLTPPAPKPVEVPGLTEQTDEGAQRILKGSGLVPVAVGDTDGTVIRQEPGAGDLVSPGSEVRYWLEAPMPSSPSPLPTSTPTPAPPPAETVGPLETWTAGESPISSESPTSSESSASSESATSSESSTSSRTATPIESTRASQSLAASATQTTRTSDAAVLLAGDSGDWRGIGLTTAIMLAVAGGALIARRTAHGRRPGKRWATSSFRVSGWSGATTTGIAERGAHSVQVVGSLRQPSYTVKEQPE